MMIDFLISASLWGSALYLATGFVAFGLKRSRKAGKAVLQADVAEPWQATPRFDRYGCDVSNLPGLWDETDTETPPDIQPVVSPDPVQQACDQLDAAYAIPASASCGWGKLPVQPWEVNLVELALAA